MAISLAALGFPMLAAGSARASIAGGNPPTTTLHPDVRSAVAVDAQDVQVCFDKPLSQASAVISSPATMHLIGYNTLSRWLNPVAATLVTSNNQCVNLAFSQHSGALDLGQFTAVAIDGGAVATGSEPNLADSVTLGTSTTHNGSAGLSTGPDLVGPAPVSTPANSIAFVFDQSIEPLSVPLSATHFWYENTAGNFCYSSNVAQVSPTTIVAMFPTATSATCNDTIAPAPSVANARRAGVDGGAVSEPSDAPILNAPQGTNMPNAANGGTTTIASLVGASLDTASGNQVTFTFDHPLNRASVTDPTKFHVLLANGETVAGSALSGVGSKSAVVTFTNLNLFDEYAIQASVDATAVQASPATSGCSSNVIPCPATSKYTNTPGAVAIGGNAGAFARGFTTGSDLYMISFNRAGNSAILFLDQRPFGAPGGTTGVNLIDAHGTVVGHATKLSIPPFLKPGPVAITITIDPAVMASNPVQIQLDGPTTVSGVSGFCELRTALGGDGCSVPQVVEQTGSAVHIRGVGPPRPLSRPRPRRRRLFPDR